MSFLSLSIRPAFLSWQGPAVVIVVVISSVLSGLACGHAAGVVDSPGLAIALALLLLSIPGALYIWAQLLARRSYSEVNLSPSLVLGAERDVDQKALTIVIPVSRISTDRVLPTVLSALFQDYQSKRVVLLLDDSTIEAVGGLDQNQSKEIPGSLNQIFSYARSLIHRSYSKFTLNETSLKEERHRLGVLCQNLSFIFARFQVSLSSGTSESEFAAQNVLGTYQKVFVESATRIMCGQAEPEREELERFYGNLLRLFSVQLVVFDSMQFREQFNMRGRASSLNLFLACMGRPLQRSLQNVRRGRGQQELRECHRNETAEIIVPESFYVMVVQEGTVLLPEYASTLVKLMEAAQFKKVAVAQAELIEKVEDYSPCFRTVMNSKFLKGVSSFWLGDCVIFRKAAFDDILAGGFSAGSTNSTRVDGHRAGFDQTEFNGREQLTLALPLGGWSLLTLRHGLYFRGGSSSPEEVALRRSRRAVCGRICSYYRRGATNLRVHLILDSALRAYYLMTTLLLTAIILGAYLKGGSFTSSFWLCGVLMLYHFLYTPDMQRRGYRKLELAQTVYGDTLNSFRWFWSGVQSGTGRFLRFMLDGPVLGTILWGAGIAVGVSLVIMYWQSPQYFAAFWLGVSILAILGAILGVSYYLFLIIFRRDCR